MDKFCRVIYILIVFVYASEGQQDNTTAFFERPAAISVPFCGNETEMHNQIVPYFDSNATHIWDIKRNISTNFTRREALICTSNNGRYIIEGFEGEDIIGFTYDSSLIFLHEGRLVSPTNYCWAESTNESVEFILCSISHTNTAQIDIVTIYLSCLSISTICYFGSAIIYYFILKVQDDHKKCFVGYSLSMGMTFTVLILLQVVNIGCEVLGSLFFMFLFSSFVWLTCLCADLNLMIRHFRGDNEQKHLYLYISLAILYPCCMLIISLCIKPMGSPDIPSSFMKKYGGMCKFGGNTLMFFIPTGLLALLSIVLLCHSFYLIWLNEKQYRNDFSWLEKRSELRYTLGSCSLLILPTAIWIIDVSFRNTTLRVGNEYVLDCIEASQGIFAVAIFVFNRYTRRQIRYALYKNEEHKPLQTRWQDLVERFDNDKVPDDRK